MATDIRIAIATHGMVLSDLLQAEKARKKTTPMSKPKTEPESSIKLETELTKKPEPAAKKKGLIEELPETKPHMKQTSESKKKVLIEELPDLLPADATVKATNKIKSTRKPSLTDSGLEELTACPDVKPKTRKSSLSLGSSSADSGMEDSDSLHISPAKNVKCSSAKCVRSQEREKSSEKALSSNNKMTEETGTDEIPDAVKDNLKELSEVMDQTGYKKRELKLDDLKVAADVLNQKDSKRSELEQSDNKESNESVDDLKELNGKDDEDKLPENSNEKKLSELEQAYKELLDPLVPVRGHGLITLRRLVEKGDSSALDQHDVLMGIFRENLGHNDSYIYLSAIQGMAALAGRRAKEALPVIVKVSRFRFECMYACVCFMPP